MASSSLYQIEKLDEKNFETWNIQIKSVLIHSGYWRYVNGDEKKIPTWDAAKKLEWDITDEKALATIMLSVKSSQINYIKNCVTSHEAWMKLKEIYKPSGPIQKVSLYKKLLSLNMKECNNMVEYLNTFSDIVDKLNEIGIQLQDELLVIILLSSLPKDYENFVMIIETRDALPSLSVVKVKLLEETERRNNQDAEGSSNQQAFGAIKKDNFNKNNKNKKGSVNPKAVKGICFVCGKKGHYANKCKSRIVHQEEKSYSLVAMANHKVSDSSKWYIDSGATCHMCSNRKFFTTFIDTNDTITLADNKSISAKGKGVVKLKINKHVITFKDVLYSPDLKGNFISVIKVTQYGGTFKFNKNGAYLMDENEDVLIHAKPENNLFVFDGQEAKEQLNAVSSNNQLWHKRYGHLNYQSLKELCGKEMVNGLDLNKESQEQCKTCMVCKIHKVAFPNQSENKSDNVLDLIHSDLCGPMNVESIGGSKYFLTFIDDKSRRVWVYFLKRKSEVFEHFKNFKSLVERQTGRQIKALRSDNGGEYINNQFNKYLEECGIQRQLTVPYTPQQNGVAERYNRTLVEMARCLLVESRLDTKLWAEAISTAAYLRNRCPSKSLHNKTPHEVWTGRKPNVKHLKVFGSTAVVLNNKRRGKFDQKGSMLIMVGYSLVSKAYRLYDKEANKVIECRDVLFDENCLPGTGRDSSGKEFISFNDLINTSEDHESENQAAVIDDEEVEITSEVQTEDSECESYYDMDDFNGFTSPSEDISEVTSSGSRGPGRPKVLRTAKPGRPRKVPNLLNNVVENQVPKTFKEALSSKNSEKWQEAMIKEMSSLQDKGTWSLAELPAQHKAIKCKWVYSLKKNQHGEVVRHKARLVAKGCSQRYGIDYKETFSPVVRYATIRMLLALAVEHKMHLHQLDIVTAYLNGDLHDEIYMQQPEGFVDESNPNKVLRLHKSLYGLKQAGREWNTKLNDVLCNIGFERCKNEPCLYKMIRNKNLIIIAVYVDDIIIGCKDKNEILKIKSQIASEFEITDKGLLEHFLGMEVNRDGETGDIKLSQEVYIKELLQEYGMEDCKTSSVPLEPVFQVSCTGNCEKVDTTKYQSLIGALLYLALTTRPDIIHSVSKLAQRNSDPHVEHWVAAKRILRYLKGSIKLKLKFSSGSQNLEGYADADWGGCAIDRKSYSGFVFYFGKNIISWESKKQSTTALSSTEAEYMSVSNACKEAVYLRRLLQELGFWKDGSVILNVDNQGALKLATNPVYHNRSKHIDIKYHHIRDVIQSKEVELKYCPTDDMIADIFTKNLPKAKHLKFVNLLNLI